MQPFPPSVSARPSGVTAAAARDPAGSHERSSRIAWGRTPGLWPWTLAARISSRDVAARAETAEELNLSVLTVYP